MAEDEGNEIVKEREGEGEGGGAEGKSSKKLFIIIGAVLVLASGGFVFMQMGEEPAEIQDENKEAALIKEEEGDQTNFTELQAKPILLVELGEIVCPMRRLAAGVTRRSRIKLDVALILKPHYNYELQMFDQEQNTAMVARFESLKPLLRQIVINTVLDSDPNEEPDPKTLARRIKKHINNYDATTKDVKGTYGAFFGQGRVLEVYFPIFEPR